MDFSHEGAEKRAELPLLKHVYDLINTREILHCFTPPAAKRCSKRGSTLLHSLFTGANDFLKWTSRCYQQLKHLLLSEASLGVRIISFYQFPIAV